MSGASRERGVAARYLFDVALVCSIIHFRQGGYLETELASMTGGLEREPLAPLARGGSAGRDGACHRRRAGGPPSRPLLFRAACWGVARRSGTVARTHAISGARGEATNRGARRVRTERARSASAGELELELDAGVRCVAVLVAGGRGVTRLAPGARRRSLSRWRSCRRRRASAARFRRRPLRSPARMVVSGGCAEEDRVVVSSRS